MRVFSYGGGVQSTAALVLAAHGRIDFGVFLFANVGEDSENPDTLAYVEQVAKPFAASHGIELHELQRVPTKGKYAGKVETVYGRCVGDNRSVVIPIRMSNGAPGNRSCTNDFKIRVIAAWLKKHGATKAQPAITGLGISWDEMTRMRTDSGIAWQTLEYPLIDLRLTRDDCKRIIADAGLPVPSKSSCWFCPFQKPSEWRTLAREKPDLFAKAIALEERINDKRDAIGRDVVYLHPALVPLERAVMEQLDLFGDDICDSGYCFV